MWIPRRGGGVFTPFTVCRWLKKSLILHVINNLYRSNINWYRNNKASSIIWYKSYLNYYMENVISKLFLLRVFNAELSRPHAQWR